MKEFQIIEWKPFWQDEYLKWICGLANAEGGVLVIGGDGAAATRVGGKLGERLGEKLGETRAAIVKAMQANPRTKSGIAEVLG